MIKRLRKTSLIRLFAKFFCQWNILLNQIQLKHKPRAASWQDLFMPYANNKDADEPAHPRSLISAFVVRCLDSIIPIVDTSKDSWL